MSKKKSKKKLKLLLEIRKLQWLCRGTIEIPAEYFKVPERISLLLSSDPFKDLRKE